MSDIQYGLPSAQFLAKHGRPKCGLCKKEGRNPEEVFIPLGYPKSVFFKKQHASCQEHLNRNKNIARQALMRDSDTSEAAFQLSSRYGI